jgi:hypothetical protein
MDKMDKFLWILVLILIVAAAVMIGIRLGSGSEDAWICQNNQWVKRGNPTAAMPTTACVSSDNQNLTEEGSDLSGSGTLKWSEALSMIKNCEVLRIAQTHNRNVDMWLKDGRQVWTVEPNLDGAVQAAQNATKCGTIPISTE